MRSIGYLSLCWWLAVNSLQGQNLVPNPGFEEADSLPCSFIHWQITEPNLSAYLTDWEAPTTATSDIYSTLVDVSCPANPSVLGQQPRSGDNMAGIWIAAGSENYREYLQVRLTEALTVGSSYYAEMYILLRSDYEFASNNMGMYFSETRVTRFDDFTDVLDYSPPINEEQVVASKDRWHKVSGCFVAETAAEYLLIGNFFDLAETDTTFLADRGDFIAYYFVDDVLVEEIAPLPLNALGNDTLLCPGEVLPLSAQTPGATYRWNNFSTDATVVVEQADIYWVDITVGACTVRDSITVTYEPLLNLGPDTLLCQGESLALTLPSSGGNYQWSDGSTDTVLTIAESGTYWIEERSSSCQQTDTIRVTFQECPGFIPSVFTPNGDTSNETFYVASIENRQWKLRVFNRWGKQVYYSNNYRNDWDGNGLAAGIYFYHLQSEALQQEYQGWVQLMRDRVTLID